MKETLREDLTPQERENIGHLLADIPELSPASQQVYSVLFKAWKSNTILHGGAKGLLEKLLALPPLPSARGELNIVAVRQRALNLRKELAQFFWRNDETDAGWSDHAPAEHPTKRGPGASHKVVPVIPKSNGGGYRLLFVGRSRLKSRPTNAIGLIVSSLSDWFVGNLIEGCEKACAEAGTSGPKVIVRGSGLSPEVERREMESLRDTTLGLLVVPVQEHDHDGLYKGLKDQKVVFIDRAVLVESSRGRVCPFPQVSTKNKAVGHIGANFLFNSLGCDRVFFISDKPVLSSSVDRREGFREAIRARAQRSPKLAVELDEHGEEHFIQATGRLWYDAGHKAVATLCKEGKLKRKDGILAVNDSIAIGAIAELHARAQTGQIPFYVPVVGCDGQEVGPHLVPPLYSIKQDFSHMGYEATKRLLEWVQTDEVPEDCFITPEEPSLRQKARAGVSLSNCDWYSFLRRGGADPLRKNAKRE